MSVTPPATPTAAPTWPTPPPACPICDAPQVAQANHPWGHYVTYDCHCEIGSTSEEPAWGIVYPCENIAAQLAWRQRAETLAALVEKLNAEHAAWVDAHQWNE